MRQEASRETKPALDAFTVAAMAILASLETFCTKVSDLMAAAVLVLGRWTAPADPLGRKTPPFRAGFCVRVCDWPGDETASTWR